MQDKAIDPTTPVQRRRYRATWLLCILLIASGACESVLPKKRLFIEGRDDVSTANPIFHPADSPPHWMNLSDLDIFKHEQEYHGGRGYRQSELDEHTLNSIDEWKKSDYVMYVLRDTVDHVEPGGKVFLSFSTLGKDANVRMFIILHEIAHLTLGHLTANSDFCPGFSPSYGNNRYTALEDAADEFAARAIAKRNRPIGEVFDHLYKNSFYRTGNNGTHSDGRIRAALVLRAYVEAGGNEFTPQWLFQKKQQLRAEGLGALADY